MSVFSARKHIWLMVASAVALGGCTSPTQEAIDITPEDVALAYVAEGMSQEVADCLVGLGSREFDLDLLLPGAAADLDALLIDEMRLSCLDALAALSEEELAERTTFDTGPFNIGDDDYLDELWFACDNGDGAACDQLWEEAPIGSAYEAFGVSCGNRPAILDCTEEMNGPDLTAEGAR